MGTEPVEDEIPIELEDLAVEIQEAFKVYYMLQDMFDSTAGVYLGKNYAGISDIFEVFELEDKQTIYYILNIIDKHRSAMINKKSTTAKNPSI